VFEHLTRPYETAVELAGLLRVGGILRISVPSGLHTVRRLKVGDWSASTTSLRTLNSVAPLQHVNCFRHRSLVELGRRAGLELVTLTPRLRYRYVPTWEPPKRLFQRTVLLHYRALRHQDTIVWLRRTGDEGSASAS
jgi:hypothetical protein